MKVIYSFGWIGGYGGNETILLNSNLKKYPKFHDIVLEHEKRHLKDKHSESFYSIGHLLNDVKDLVNPIFRGHSFLFNLRHPTSLLPFFYWKDHGESNIGIVIPWVFVYEALLIMVLWGFLYG